MVMRLYRLGVMAYNTFADLWTILSKPVVDGLSYIAEKSDLDLSWLVDLLKILTSIPILTDMTLFELIIGTGVIIVVYVSLIKWVLDIAQ